MKYPDCPDCGCYNLADVWRRGRKLRQECRECDWVGVERTPEQRAIVATRRIALGLVPSVLVGLTICGMTQLLPYLMEHHTLAIVSVFIIILAWCVGWLMQNT